MYKRVKNDTAGSFNVRIQPDLHRELVHISQENGETLNAVVERALRMFSSQQSNKTV
ncbi:MAG: type II toxin-antitoxin system HicB family antitoxin [Acetatifactor muris]|nr:type II toxin-antitoxin system HicB family antitoxin [Acetatifactor muris]